MRSQGHLQSPAKHVKPVNVIELPAQALPSRLTRPDQVHGESIPINKSTHNRFVKNSVLDGRLTRSR